MKLLIVDDDRDLVAALTVALQRAAFDVLAARSAPIALRLLEMERPDLVVLDSDLRAWNSFELLKELRRRSPATAIILIGCASEEERVLGLELGAHDYVSKPFSTRELVARIRALLHYRGEDAPDPRPTAPVLQVGPLALNAAAHTAEIAARALALTPTEFRLLHYLMAHAGVALTMAALLRDVWGYDDPSATDVVRTTVYRLRRKLGDLPTEPRLLQAIPGVGFILKAEPAPSPQISGASAADRASPRPGSAARRAKRGPPAVSWAAALPAAVAAVAPAYLARRATPPRIGRRGGPAALVRSRRARALSCISAMRVAGGRSR